MFMGQMSSEEFLHSVIHTPEKQDRSLKNVSHKYSQALWCNSHLISHNGQCTTYLSPEAE